jgi:hypothetical protein
VGATKGAQAKRGAEREVEAHSRILLPRAFLETLAEA